MADLIISILVLLFSIFYIIATIELPETTVIGVIGPKGFPLFIGSLLILLTSILLLKSLKLARPWQKKKVMELRARRGNLSLVIVAMIGYIYILGFVGYILSTFLFLITVLMVWNRKRPYLNIAIALGYAISVYLLLTILKIPLPERIFGLP